MSEVRGDLDLAQKTVGTQAGRELWTEHLECDETVVLQITREIDCGHPAAAELALDRVTRSEEHTSELQSQSNLVCRLLLETKKYNSELQTQSILVCRLLLVEKEHRLALSRDFIHKWDGMSVSLLF